ISSTRKLFGSQPLKRKLKMLSIAEKVTVIRAVEKGDKKKVEIAKQFGIPTSALSTFLKEKEKILKLYSEKSCGHQKRMRECEYPVIEQCVLKWFVQARDRNVPIDGKLLQAKAEEFAKELGHSEFKASNGWLDKFKKRHGIVFNRLCANQVLLTMTANWFQSTLPSILEEYEAKDVFNADETGLFYRCLPNKTLLFKGQSCSGGKLSKERITVLVGCNSDGSEKLPLFVIGKSLKSRCFKNVRTLPVEYTANKKAWKIATMFTDWIVKLDERFFREKRKVAMIIDNCPAHPNVVLKAIKLIFLPPNTTSVLQPCDQGIIQNMKFFYRKQLLRKYLLAIEANEDFSINLLDALHMLHSAWNSVTPRTIENCFHHAGFSKVSDSLAPKEMEKEDIETEPTLNEMFEKVSVLLDCPTVSSEEFVAVDDDNVCTAPIMADKDILEFVQSSKNIIDADSDDENEMNNAAPVPTSSEMRNIMKSMLSYLDAHSNDEMNNKMDDIEQFSPQFRVKRFSLYV
uniref:Tigger transposable element-derived protein 4 n=1 Tax=Erpetoichthys calabaricus TaxID=27687 RepID=A0A8C4RRF5_ERPCA